MQKKNEKKGGQHLSVSDSHNAIWNDKNRDIYTWGHDGCWLGLGNASRSDDNHPIIQNVRRNICKQTKFGKIIFESRGFTPSVRGIDINANDDSVLNDVLVVKVECGDSYTLVCPFVFFCVLFC